MAYRRLQQRLSFLDRRATYGLIRGLAASLRAIFRGSVTTGRPENRRGFSAAMRGRPRLTRDANGDSRCVACFLCEAACPANCIRVEAGPVPDALARRPGSFTIDLAHCLFCGLCAEACPEGAIASSQQHDSLAVDSAEELVFELEQLLLPR